MRSLKQFTVCVLLILLAACGGGGNGYIPDPGNGSDNGNPPATDSGSLALGDLQITCPVEGNVVGGKATSISTNAAKLDGLQSVAISVDGTDISTGQQACLWDTTELANGTHTVKVSVQTLHGNATDTVQVKVDNKVPRFEGGHVPSAVGQVVIDSVTPSSIPWGYAGEVEVHGSGFYSLDPDTINVFFLPSGGIDTLRGNYTSQYGLEVVSDTLLVIDLSVNQPPINNPNPVGLYSIVVGDQHCGSSMIIDAMLSDCLYVSPTTNSPGISSSYSLPANPVSDVVIDVYAAPGRNIPSANCYIVRLDKNDYVKVGDDLFDANWGMYSSRVDKIDANHLRATFDATIWRDWIPVGAYTLTLSCHDGTGVWSPKADWSTAVTPEGDPLPPAVDASATPTSGDSPLVVQFAGSAQSQNDGADILDVWWDFDNDGSIDSHDQNPVHTFTLPEGVGEKQYLVTFGATDSLYCFNTCYLWVSVQQPGSDLAPPVVEARASPTQGESPLLVQFQAIAASSNSGGSIVSYQWDYNRDGVWDSTEANPMHMFTLTAGESNHVYNVKLGVTDSFGMYAEDTVAVTVTEAASVLNAPYFTSLEYSPYPAITGDPEGVTITFVANVVLTNVGGSIAHVLWDFNSDGTYDEDSGSSLVVNHYYQRPSAAYQDSLMTVKVIDSFGMTGMESQWVTVRQGHKPYVYFSYDQDSSVSPATVTFASQAVALDDQAIVSYEWDLNGDGEFDATGASAQYVYTVPDNQERTWYVMHRVTDSLGRSDYYVGSITVQGQQVLQSPYVTIEPQSVSGQAPLTVNFSLSAGVYNDAEVAGIWWYANNAWVSTGWSWSNTFYENTSIRVELVDTNGLRATSYATISIDPVVVEEQDPDLPPIIIQGDNDDDSYDPDNAGVGDGAPNGTVQQAFKDAYDRAQGDAGRPTTQVYRFGSGYIQDLYGGRAGAGAIMMKDGQSQAAWIHGDIYHKYISLGGPGGYLGYPIKDEALGSNSSFGTPSAYTLFSGDGYAQAQLIYHQSGARSGQVFEVRGAIYNKWQSLGGNGGSLGLPVSDQYSWSGGWRSDFEGGYLFCNSSGQVSVNGTGGGGGGGGSDVPSSIVQKFQQKRNSISASELGSPTTNVSTRNGYYYQRFEGGTGWIGALVYNSARSTVYWVHGAIFNVWWGNMENRLGLPVSDEKWDAQGRRSDFDYGYIVWNSANDTCDPRTYDGTPVDGTFIYTPHNLVTTLISWFVGDLNAIDSQGSQKLSGYFDSGAIVLSLVPGERFAVKAVETGAEKTADLYQVIKKAIKLETSGSDREAERVVVEQLAKKGRTEFRAWNQLTERLTSWQRARLYGLADNETLLVGFEKYIQQYGEGGVTFVEHLVKQMPDRLTDLASIDLNPEALRSILQYHGYSVDKMGIDQLVGHAVSDGQVFFARRNGQARILLHNRNNALIEIDATYATPKVVSIVANADPYTQLHSYYSDVVQIR